MVPTIFDADKKGLRQIAADARASPARSATAGSPAGALRRHLLGVEPGDVRGSPASARSSTHPRPGSSRSGRSPTSGVKDGESSPAK